MVSIQCHTSVTVNFRFEFSKSFAHRLKSSTEAVSTLILFTISSDPSVLSFHFLHHDMNKDYSDIVLISPLLNDLTWCSYELYVTSPMSCLVYIHITPYTTEKRNPAAWVCLQGECLGNPLHDRHHSMIPLHYCHLWELVGKGFTHVCLSICLAVHLSVGVSYW